MLAGVLTLVLLLVPAVVHGTPTLQEVLLRAKPAVALVVSEVGSTIRLRCPGGDETTTPPPLRETGTGWFINPNGWLITNAHVVSAAHRPSASVRTPQAQNAVKPGCRIIDVQLEPSISVILSNGFRLSATVAKFSPPVSDEAMSGQDLVLLKLEAADMPTLSLGDSDAAKIGDRLHILGFPGVVLSHELLNASAKVEATVTNGAISGFRQDRAGQPVTQTDAPAAWGNSGGPAIDDRGDVVGVLTFVALSGEQSDFVQGFNFIIPARAVRNFLEGTGVKLDEPGAFNRAWHQALGEFFAGNHQRAAAAFTEANRRLPELPDVMRLSQENTERIKNPPPRPFPWALVAGGVVVLALIVGSGALARRWYHGRYRITPAEVARLLDTVDPPVLLDVRDAGVYERSPIRIPNARHVPAHSLAAGRPELDIEAGRTVVAYCT